MTRTLLFLSSLAVGFTALVAFPAPLVAAAPVCPEGGITTFDIDSNSGTDSTGNADYAFDVSWEIDGDGNITVSAVVTLGTQLYLTGLGYTGTFQGDDGIAPAQFLVDLPMATSVSHTFAPEVGQIDITEVHVSVAVCPAVEQPTTTAPTTTMTAGSGGSLPSTGGRSDAALLAVIVLAAGGALTLAVRRPRTQA